MDDNVKFLSGNLYSVPFSLIKVPEEKEGFFFKNPRTLTEKGRNDLIDRNHFSSLKQSIKNIGLLNPFICRWIKDENGEEFPQLIGGDRRYRVLKELIDNKELVENTQTKEKVSADLFYENVICQIYPVSNDLEAYLLSWWENKDRIDLTEGHEVAQVIQLRKYNIDDNDILSVLKKDSKWLRETDNLISNLGQSLNDLIENKITRDCALALIKIDDLDKRNLIKEKAEILSIEKYDNKLARIKEEIEKQIDIQNIAEGQVVVAAFKEDENAKEKAALKVEQAKKLKEEKQDEILGLENRITEKDLKQAEKLLNPAKNEEKQICLKYSKIKEGVDYLDNIEKEFLNYDLLPEDLRAIKLASMILKNNVLSNNSDWKSTLENFFSI